MPTIATHVPAGTQPDSRVKRFARWIRQARVTEEVYFAPYAEVLVTPRALQTLGLVIDGSVGGRGGVALLLHVVDTGRALPVAWLGRPGKKGHFPEDRHSARIEQVQDLIPAGARGV